MDGSAILARLRVRLGARALDAHERFGDHTLVVAREGIVDALAYGRGDAELRFDMLMDLTAVDYQKFPGREDGPRFDVVYHLLSIPNKQRVRLKVQVSGDDANVDSLTPIWPSANFFEREIFDLFGVRFIGHPYLRRLLMPEDWEGHPLRKDYPVEGYR